MSKPYDATTKSLVETNPHDWVTFLGLPDGPASLLDADLSTVNADADRVIYVGANVPYVLHLEFQSGEDDRLIERCFRYGVLIWYRYQVTVETVLVLLRPIAHHRLYTGEYRVRDSASRRSVFTFRYRVLRLWEETPETFLNGGLSLLPFAPLAARTRDEAQDVMETVKRRIREELPDRSEAAKLYASTFVLLGLRFDAAFAQRLMQGVLDMRESVTYQAILNEGRAEGLTEGLVRGELKGELKGERGAVLRVGRKRLGEPDPLTNEAIQAIEDPERLNVLLNRILEVESWQELLR